MNDSAADAVTGIVLDFLPHGRSDEGRPSFDAAAIAHVLEPSDFGLYELEVTEDASVGIGDRISIDPPADYVLAKRSIEHENLTGGASAELEYVIDELLEEEEDRFVAVFNEAQPITLRLHQLDLLAGIGDTLRDAILDARKREQFTDFEDVAARIDGLHNPEATISERIIEELSEEPEKYYLFVDGPY